MLDVLYMPAARNYLKKIKDKKLMETFRQAINEIREDYTIGEEKKGDLKGIYGYDVFYNKTNYEISYIVEELEDKTVIIILVGTRENFYQELKKYIKNK